jgi:hypothetical protein
MASNLSFDIFAKDRASKVFDNVGKSADRTHKTFGKVGAGLASVGKLAATGLAGGVAVAGVAMVKFIGDARESQKISRLTAQVIKSTGGAAKITANQVGTSRPRSRTRPVSTTRRSSPARTCC